jgi:hypothetical protein
MKVLEGVCFRHQRRLRNRPARLKQIYSDKADWAGSWQTFQERSHFARTSNRYKRDRNARLREH